MKRFYALLLGIALAVTPMMALTYDDAARQAYYLTDKMAYELNLTDAQYDRVYQINFDYFLRCERESDLYGYLWEYRNARLARILATAQWRLYNDALYFYRPLRWMSGAIHFAIYDRYHRDRFYRPVPPPSYHGPAYGHYRPGHNGHQTPPPAHGRPGHGHDNYRPAYGGHDNYRPGHSGNNYRPNGNNDRPGNNYRPGHSGNDQRPGGNDYRPGGNKPEGSFGHGSSKPEGNFGGGHTSGGYNRGDSQSGSRGGFSGHGRR